MLQKPWICRAPHFFLRHHFCDVSFHTKSHHFLNLEISNSTGCALLTIKSDDSRILGGYFLYGPILEMEKSVRTAKSVYQ